jgi:pimeloyl-ACP methyl ester carboxylesterase
VEQRTTTLDDSPVRWLEHGEGRPVVLVHGIPTSPALWRRVMPLVEGRTLAVEMLGYGASIGDADAHDIGLSSQADRLLSWLDALELDGAVLVGHDLGGGVAQIAGRRPRDDPDPHPGRQALHPGGPPRRRRRRRQRPPRPVSGAGRCRGRAAGPLRR